MKGTTFYNSAVSMSQAKPWNNSTSTINETLSWRTPPNKPVNKCRSNLINKVNKNIVILNKKYSTQPEILDFFSQVGSNNDTTKYVDLFELTHDTTQAPNVNINVVEQSKKQSANISILCTANGKGSMAVGNDEQPCDDGNQNSIASCNALSMNSVGSYNDTVALPDLTTTHATEVHGVTSSNSATYQDVDKLTERPVKNSHPNSVCKGNTIFEYRVLDLLDENLLAEKPKQLDAKNLGTINYLKLLKIGDYTKVPAALHGICYKREWMRSSQALGVKNEVIGKWAADAVKYYLKTQQKRINGIFLGFCHKNRVIPKSIDNMIMNNKMIKQSEAFARKAKSLKLEYMSNLIKEAKNGWKEDTMQLSFAISKLQNNDLDKDDLTEIGHIMNSGRILMARLLWKKHRTKFYKLTGSILDNEKVPRDEAI